MVVIIGHQCFDAKLWYIATVLPSWYSTMLLRILDKWNSINKFLQLFKSFSPSSLTPLFPRVTRYTETSHIIVWHSEWSKWGVRITLCKGSCSVLYCETMWENFSNLQGKVSQLPPKWKVVVSLWRRSLSQQSDLYNLSEILKNAILKHCILFKNDGTQNYTVFINPSVSGLDPTILRRISV